VSGDSEAIPSPPEQAGPPAAEGRLSSRPPTGPPATDGTGEPTRPVANGAKGSATATPFRLGNRPPLTGIRALALSTVLVYHSNFKTLPGAWVALQIFFVLSGFLITAMLSSEGMRNGRVSLKQFYGRRAVRLVPPLVLTVVLLAIYASFVHVADASQRLWGDSAAAMFYYADYRQAFGHAPFFGYLAQTWSLSVEEQFYIIWSILLVVAVAVHRRRLAYVFAVVGLVASVGDRLWQVYSVAHFYTPKNVAFTRVYYAFDTRADALFIGCLLGLLATDGLLQHWRPWAMRTLTVAAIASTGVLVWTLLGAPLFRENVVVWWLPLSTVASAVVITYFVMHPTSIASRLVGIGVLVFIGDLSYTVYLLHFPVYLAITPGQYGTHWSYWPTQLARLAVIFGIAIASWFLIEKPLARWRQRSAAR
jgi:peptidoglycan/LPS O-acetylase OafA/YrhL